MDHIKRNYEIIEKSMIKQMERSFEVGKKLIDSELDAGLFNFLVKPAVKMFYDYWTNSDAREGTLQQIKTTLDCGKDLVMNGVSEDAYNKKIEEHFPAYLEGDQTFRQCKKNHRNFEKLKKITKDCFVTQVEETVMFLGVEDENIECYDDLVRAVFKNKENARKSLMRQLDYNEAGIKIVEKDPSILKIITGKSIIIKALRKGFDITKKELLQGLDETF
ncbi:MAG: hypothetical protein EU544_02615 [Promethearchaeota archaeon]|nr:MAG: hypothetical protein EU544_02615 [Candidatus Lokiarchaeota archaeon]